MLYGLIGSVYLLALILMVIYSVAFLLSGLFITSLISCIRFYGGSHDTVVCPEHRKFNSSGD